MTIQTPTSELEVGLPDVAALTRLAGEFFSALPGGLPKPTPPSALGGVPAPSNVLPGGTATGPLTQGPPLPGTLLPGAKVPRLAGARLVFEDGVAVASLVAGEVNLLQPGMAVDRISRVRQALI